MKVLHVLPSLEMGGMERMVADLARATKARGWQVAVLCTSTDGALSPALREGDIPVSVVPHLGAASWLGGGALYQAIREAAPDVVHTHSGVWWRSVVAAARAGTPVRVHTVHGLHAREPAWGPLEKRAAGLLTDHVIGVSSSLCEYLTTTCHIPRGKVRLLPNGIDTVRFSNVVPLVFPLPQDGSPRVVRIGVVARLAPVKNLPLLLRAVAQCRSEGLAVELVIAGDGPDRAALVRLADDLSLETAAIFLGELADPAPLLAALDVFVLPSFSEGTSIALLEAMAAGCCCIATAVGGNPVVLDDGAAGLLIPNDDLGSLVRAIRTVVDDLALRRRLAGAGRARVASNFSLDRMVDRYLALYQGTDQGPQ